MSLNKVFEMKDLGEAWRILGMGINRRNIGGKVGFTPEHYIEKVLKNSVGIIQEKRVSLFQLASS